MKSISREELIKLLDEAHIKLRQRRELRFVPEDIEPWENRDFIAITNRAASEGVLIAPLRQLYVVPFQLQKRKANTTGRTEAIICDFCATWQRGSNSATISFQRDRSSVSYLCCEDLRCSWHVRGKTSASKLSCVRLRENISTEERIERLQARLETILGNV